jgi:hypothetical protein
MMPRLPLMTPTTNLNAVINTAAMTEDRATDFFSFSIIIHTLNGPDIDLTTKLDHII